MVSLLDLVFLISRLRYLSTLCPPGTKLTDGVCKSTALAFTCPTLYNTARYVFQGYSSNGVNLECTYENESSVSCLASLNVSRLTYRSQTRTCTYALDSGRKLRRNGGTVACADQALPSNNDCFATCPKSNKRDDKVTISRSMIPSLAEFSLRSRKTL